MKVACPVCWHSVWTKVVCQDCGMVQCLEYEGPKCIACGGPCKAELKLPKMKITAAARNAPERE